jgi:hypothetical protein
MRFFVAVVGRWSSVGDERTLGTRVGLALRIREGLKGGEVAWSDFPEMELGVSEILADPETFLSYK